MNKRSYPIRAESAVTGLSAMHIFYLQAGFRGAVRVRRVGDLGQVLQKELGDVKRPAHYLAIPPQMFKHGGGTPGEARLRHGARVLVEKPFGRHRGHPPRLSTGSTRRPSGLLQAELPARECRSLRDAPASEPVIPRQGNALVRGAFPLRRGPQL